MPQNIFKKRRHATSSQKYTQQFTTIASKIYEKKTPPSSPPTYIQEIPPPPKRNKQEIPSSPPPQRDMCITLPPPPKNTSLLPFEPCSSIMVAGPTGSGKTRWTFNFLQQLDYLYLTPTRKILYCYGVYQDLFDDMEKRLSTFTLHRGLPTSEEIEEFAGGKHDLIILDDLMHDVLESKTGSFCSLKVVITEN